MAGRQTSRKILIRSRADAQFRNTLIEIKVGIDATRTLRTALFQLAQLVAAAPGKNGVLLLTDSIVTVQRVRAEWENAKRIMREELLARLSICISTDDGELICVPHPPDEALHRALKKVAKNESQLLIERGIKTEFEFVVQKLLLLNLFTGGEAMTVGELAAKAGCSFPTAAQVVKNLGSLIERTTDRRVRLKYFPRDKFDRFVAGSERARMSARFTDISGQPRSPETMVRRLEKMRPDHVAIGGVLGARHYLKTLDIVGTPRLDVSIHAPHGRMNLEFVKDLDPALKLEPDSQRPATLVVHAVRHSDPMFVQGEGLLWADQVECLLDLKEAGLGPQAEQFLDWQKRRAALRG
ncbi:MAG: hypothetical protein ACREJD_04030 [Phycisphaerales bacterium]